MHMYCFPHTPRLYLALVILGAGHGLVLLPVVLSLIGPPSWSDKQLPGEPSRHTEHATAAGSVDGSHRSSSRQIPLMEQPSGESPAVEGLRRTGSGQESGEQLPAMTAAGVAAAEAGIRASSTELEPRQQV